MDTDVDKAAEIAVSNPYWNPREIEKQPLQETIRRCWAGEPAKGRVAFVPVAVDDDCSRASRNDPTRDERELRRREKLDNVLEVEDREVGHR